MVQQMWRAAVSIPANIAEGFKKQGIKNYFPLFLLPTFLLPTSYLLGMLNSY
ncbi:MAG: four helix bundle protein [bacterium]